MKFEVSNYILLKYKWSSFAFQLCFKLGSLVRCFFFFFFFVKKEFLWLKVKPSSVAEISLVLEYGNTERVDSNL